VSRFLLHCTCSAACVALLASAAFGQSDSPSTLASGMGAASGIAAPGIANPTVAALAPISTPEHTVTPAIISPSLTAPMIVAPTLRIDRMADRPAPIDARVTDRPVNADVATIVRRRAAFSRPQVLMITGGALLLTGLLVDGDASSILILAGAGVGGYGLYLYLQTPDARHER
jgi:hypothetical protein